MKKTVIIFGKKQSGKSTLAKNISSKYYDNDGIIDVPLINANKPLSNSVRIYSFATPLKQFLLNSFGIEYNCLCGTDEQKNSLTHILWDNFPLEVRNKFSTDGSPRSGFMTGRQVMQVFGTDVVRKIYDSAWLLSAANYIKNEDCKLFFIPDGRFINELGLKNNLKDVPCLTIRLLRMGEQVDSLNHLSESEIDTIPLSNFDLVVPDGLNEDETVKYVSHSIDLFLRN